jgi:hypothetical protein
MHGSAITYAMRLFLLVRRCDFAGHDHDNKRERERIAMTYVTEI